MASGLPRRQATADSIYEYTSDRPGSQNDKIGPRSSRPSSREGDRPSTGDREELIRRIKRGERPQWTPSEQLLRLLAENVNEDRDIRVDRTPSISSSSQSSKQVESATKQQTNESDDHAQRLSDDQSTMGLEIERPQSALHSGDFNTRPLTSAVVQSHDHRQTTFFSTSPPRPAPSRTRYMQTLPKHSHRLAFSSLVPPTKSTPLRPRAPSLQSESSAYVLKPATSPLVRETSNVDSELDEFMDNDSPRRRNRRHTLTPIGSLPKPGNYTSLTQAARQPATIRKEKTVPAQGHQHRRSLNTSYSYQIASSPQTPPFMRSRAPSFNSDSSPRQTSMVGSYEESILRGRMSGNPSQPLNFTAELGAVAVAPHKPSCPAHVHVEFPAVYYSWPAGIGRVGSATQEPSPYVGRIDLENSLAPPKTKDKRRRQRHLRDADDYDMLDELNLEAREQRQRKRKRRDPSPQESLLGGCYRIPQKGSLQIIIKNPNNSAAKVFIVPYDLDGMGPGTKTWVRQRCYSAGPIIERPLSSKESSNVSNLGRSPSDPKSKPTLRYLIHLKICSPSRGRYYLYNEIRVVFANRVPDNKENLKYEIQMPDPKFTSFKPQPSLRRGLGSAESSALMDAHDADYPNERALRRGSYGIDSSNSILQRLPASASGPQSTSTLTPSTPTPAIQSSSYNASIRPRSFTAGTISSEQETMETDADTMSSNSQYFQSPSSDYRARNRARLEGPGTATHANRDSFNEVLSNALRGIRDRYRERGHDESDDVEADTRFAKLRLEDKRFGGTYGRPATPEPGEGLIARRLRGMGTGGTDDDDDDDSQGHIT